MIFIFDFHFDQLRYMAIGSGVAGAALAVPLFCKLLKFEP